MKLVLAMNQLRIFVTSGLVWGDLREFAEGQPQSSKQSCYFSITLQVVGSLDLF